MTGSGCVVKIESPSVFNRDTIDELSSRAKRRDLEFDAHLRVPWLLFVSWRPELATAQSTVPAAGKSKQALWQKTRSLD